MPRERPASHDRGRALVCRLLLVCGLVVVSSGAYARWYQVEVLVFRHAGGQSTGGEQWPELAVRPEIAQATRLLTTTELPASAAEDGTPPPFVLLPRGEWRLGGAARRLGSGGYELLHAAAWRQPGYGVVGARRVYIGDADEIVRVGPGGNPAPGVPRVAGTVAIKVARLLHVEVDLVYDHDGQPVRLQETRRVKLRETHYFDHPLFGVLVQVAPFALPEAPATLEVGPDEPEDEMAANDPAP